MDKDKSLLNGKGEDDVEWITVNGTHIPIEDGETKAAAIKRQFGEINQNKKTYSDQVDEVLNGSFEGTGHIRVSNKTPKVLQDIGFPDKPILISKGVIEKIINKHHLSPEQIKALPRNMGEPFLIMESSTEPNSVVEYIQAVDNNKNPIMVAVIMNKSSRLGSNYIKANIVTSEYGRRDFQTHVKNGIRNNSILFYNEKRFSRLPVNSGLQLPSIIEDLKPYNNIIRKFVKKIN